MQNHLIDSDASYPAGISPGKKIFRVNSGLYAGRIVALTASSGSEIKLTYADFPYNSWNTPAVVVDDSADYPFDAAMDADGNIYLAYTLEVSFDLVLRKLTFSNGAWSPGDLCTIYDGDDNYYPSVAIEPGGRLWAAWCRVAAGQSYVNIKLSDDDGLTWPTGISNYGVTLSSAGTTAFPKIIMAGQYCYTFYTLGASKLAYRRKHLNVTTWDAEQEIATGAALDSDFDIAISDDGKIGLVFDDDKIRFIEYNNNVWSGVGDIDDAGGIFPQIKYIDNAPYIVYLTDYGLNQKRAMFTARLQETFSYPAPFDPKENILSKVFCYRAVSGNFRDLTGPAADAISADIYHADSGVIFKESGDSLFLGMDDRFNYVKIILAVAGSGGIVSWQYWNGQEWCGFTPYGGEYHFDSSDKELLLWDDYHALPASWQKKSVNDSDCYWIKITVLSPFTTGPVGSQITALTKGLGLIIME